MSLLSYMVRKTSVMKRGREEKKSHEASPSQTRLRHGGLINFPLDLTLEILKKLPSKSLVRFQCVSKLWSSIISRRKDFIDSIVTRSLNQPPRDAHIIFHEASSKCFLAFSSATCPRKTTDKELVSVPGQYHQAVRGLVCCWSKSHRPYVVAIYNPTTRQSFYLPECNPMYMGTFFFGYDPIKNQYKVLFLPTFRRDETCQVFTLGDPTSKEWRNIQGVVEPNYRLRGVVCIKGIIYYREETRECDYPFPIYNKLMSFDVRSEKFYHIEAPKLLMLQHHNSTLINYEEKLGLISCQMAGVEIWVMELETQRWSKFFFCDMEGFQNWRIVSGTTRGEIVFVKSDYCSYDMLRVYYYDLKRNSMRYVDLENYYAEEGSVRRKYMSTICTVPDHVENTMGLH